MRPRVKPTCMRGHVGWMDPFTLLGVGSERMTEHISCCGIGSSASFYIRKLHTMRPCTVCACMQRTNDRGWVWLDAACLRGGTPEAEAERWIWVALDTISDIWRLRIPCAHNCVHGERVPQWDWPISKYSGH